MHWAGSTRRAAFQQGAIPGEVRTKIARQFTEGRAALRQRT